MKRKNSQRGGAIVEAALMMPWIAFLFAGVLDFGYYAYTSIKVQNAARAAAIQMAADQFSQLSSIGCVAAVGELQGLLNVSAGTSCSQVVSDPANIDATHPIAVCFGTLTNTPATVCGASGLYCSDCTSNSGNAYATAANPFGTSPQSIEVAVTYQAVQMIPIPGVLMGRLTLTRRAESRILTR